MLISQISLDTDWGGTYNQPRQLTRQLVSSAKFLMLRSTEFLTRTHRRRPERQGICMALNGAPQVFHVKIPFVLERRMSLKRQALDKTPEI